ncbi:hypothetical protein [Nocardia thraciensis]
MTADHHHENPRRPLTAWIAHRRWVQVRLCRRARVAERLMQALLEGHSVDMPGPIESAVLAVMLMVHDEWYPRCPDCHNGERWWGGRPWLGTDSPD